MEMLEMIWPALLAVLAAYAAFVWSTVKKRVAETPTKIDDDLVKLVEDVVAKHWEKKDAPLGNIKGLRTMEARGVDNE